MIDNNKSIVSALVWLFMVILIISTLNILHHGGGTNYDLNYRYTIIPINYRYDIRSSRQFIVLLSW